MPACTLEVRRNAGIKLILAINAAFPLSLYLSDNYTHFATHPPLLAVVILSVRGLLVRKFMLAAHAMGMTNGDWTFLDVEIFPVSDRSGSSNNQSVQLQQCDETAR